MNYSLAARADAAGLAAEGVQLLSLGCGGARVADLAACLGMTPDGRLSLHDVPEGRHLLHFPRLGQVQCLPAGRPASCRLQAFITN